MKLTGKRIHEFIKSHDVNPEGVDALHGAGILSKLAGIINKYKGPIMDVVGKVAPKVIDAGVSKFAPKLSKYAPALKEGVATAVKAVKGGKLNPKLRFRAEWIGQQMKGKKMTMKEASDAFCSTVVAPVLALNKYMYQIP